MYKTKGIANSSQLSRLDSTASAEQPPQSIYDNIQQHLNSEIRPNQLCMKPRTKNRSRESERLKRYQPLPLRYRYSERRKGVHVAAAIKIPSPEQVLWPPFCLLLRARACEKTWVQAKRSTNQIKLSLPDHQIRKNATTFLIQSSNLTEAFHLRFDQNSGYITVKWDWEPLEMGPL